MGLYSESILPRLFAWGMGGEGLHEHRRAALAGCAGRVLELGFGAGHNLDFYPDGVTEVLAIEPASLNRRLAAVRVVRSAIPVRWVGRYGEALPVDAESVDAVVSTWTLCSIPDIATALAEVRRVLKPGAALHFVEHGAADEPRVLRQQERWNGLQRRVFGGCRLDRRFDALLGSAGFELLELEKAYMRGPKFLSYLYRGRAVPR